MRLPVMPHRRRATAGMHHDGGVEQGRAGRLREVSRDHGGASGAARHAWRKRVGVEPTKNRLAALPGFEVRTSHRGAFLFPGSRHRPRGPDLGITEIGSRWRPIYGIVQPTATRSALNGSLLSTAPFSYHHCGRASSRMGRPIDEHEITWQSISGFSGILTVKTMTLFRSRR